jgi:hypothetical protein
MVTASPEAAAAADAPENGRGVGLGREGDTSGDEMGE